MNFKRIGAAVVVAGALAFPLAACGSSAPPAPTATAAPTTLSSGFHDSYCNINSSTRKACEQHDTEAAKPPAPAHPASSGLPWWSWLLIVPAGLIAALVIGLKLLEWSDERTISRAQARVAELDARPRSVQDYDDWAEDDEEDYPYEDELDDGFEYPTATDPVPAPAPSTPPAGGGSLLSSLRQQSQ